MENETDSFGIQKLNSTEPVMGLGRSALNEDKKKRKRRQFKQEAHNFFHTLFTAAEDSNEQLKKKGLPYRFHVHQEGEEVFIDVVILNTIGEIVETKRKNISHDDFELMIEDVSQIEGLLFDGMA
jgi:hypothetical protein